MSGKFTRQQPVVEYTIIPSWDQGNAGAAVSVLLALIARCILRLELQMKRPLKNYFPTSLINNRALLLRNSRTFKST